MPTSDALLILFRDLLRISQYPGSPFTGNPVYDVVQFFFIPMVFIIFFVYQILGRMPLHGASWLRALFGIALFLYMVVNGWFAAFALWAGPYFLFLIIVLGLLYFIPSHFRRGEEGGHVEAAPAGGRPTAMPEAVLHRQHRGDEVNLFERRRLKKELQDVREDLANAKHRLETAINKGSRDAEHWGQEVTRLRQEERRLEEALKIIKW